LLTAQLWLLQERPLLLENYVEKDSCSFSFRLNCRLSNRPLASHAGENRQSEKRQVTRDWNTLAEKDSSLRKQSPAGWSAATIQNKKDRDHLAAFLYH
jgi:hypothetical protein